jgi:hypothetical protein
MTKLSSVDIWIGTEVTKSVSSTDMYIKFNPKDHVGKPAISDVFIPEGKSYSENCSCGNRKRRM